MHFSVICLTEQISFYFNQYNSLHWLCIYATVGRRRRKGGGHDRRQWERWKGSIVEVRVRTLNVGTVTDKGRELADMMERRKVDILCVQETRWRGSKTRSIRDGFKLFYHGVDGRRNGVGVIMKEEYVKGMLEVKRMCTK